MCIFLEQFWFELITSITLREQSEFSASTECLINIVIGEKCKKYQCPMKQVVQRGTAVDLREDSFLGPRNQCAILRTTRFAVYIFPHSLVELCVCDSGITTEWSL